MRAAQAERLIGSMSVSSMIPARSGTPARKVVIYVTSGRSGMADPPNAAVDRFRSSPKIGHSDPDETDSEFP
jgi:hypothetical protein